MIGDAALIDDRHLLEHYARTRDAKAFAELAKRYAGLVYGTCLRVTQNPDDAEDVSQECFLELARRAGSINSSVAGWLHKVARTRSVNAIKKASALREREQRAFADASDDSESAWDEIAPYIDAAVERLPNNLRLPTILHYFHGIEQTRIAGQLRVSQSTVSRHLDKAVAVLREELRNAGIVAPVAVLAVLLTGNGSTAAPASLTAALGKMAIAGVGGSAAASGAFGLHASAQLAARQVFGTMAGKLAVGALVVMIGASVAYKAGREVIADAAVNAPALAARVAPSAVSRMAAASKPVARPTAIVSPMETSRNDPFTPPDYRRPVTDRRKLNAPITDLPIPRMTTGRPVIDRGAGPAPEPDQPVRRMAGLIRNNGLCAIIESNGETQIVQPGDTLNDRLAVVERIEQNRTILKTTGDNPRYIIVGLTPAPIAARPDPLPTPSPAPGIAAPAPGIAAPGIGVPVFGARPPAYRTARPAAVMGVPGIRRAPAYRR